MSVVDLMVSERVLDLLIRIFGVIIIVISMFVATVAAVIFMYGLMYFYISNFIISISLYVATVGCVLAGVRLVESDEFDGDFRGDLSDNEEEAWVDVRC